MSAKILDGKAVSKRVEMELGEEVQLLSSQGIQVGLAVIIVGNDPASKIYVGRKKKCCERVGIKSFEYALPAEASEDELINLINTLNADPKVNGILCQLPLPKHISEDKIINTILPEKDVDCFHPFNVGRLMTGNPNFLPCTPAGVMELIRESGIEVSGKECVVVGRSNIVGKPQAMLLLAQNGTVTICHSRTRDLKEVCRRADILVAAVGKAQLIEKDFIKPGAVVIDVGMNRIDEHKVVGDVNFEGAKEVAGAITPVPGGVGPMTIAMLIKNAVRAARLQNGLS